MGKSKQAQKEEKAAANLAKQSRESVLESLFDDMYSKRWKVYRFNFFRGIFLGLGTAVGGTAILALVVWVISWFIDWPFVQQIVDSFKR